MGAGCRQANMQAVPGPAAVCVASRLTALDSLCIDDGAA